MEWKHILPSKFLLRNKENNMKMIVAMIQPNKLPSVKKSLFDAGVKKMTVTNVLGCGQQSGFHENYRGNIHEINLLKKVRLEVAVNEAFLNKTIDAIIEGSQTGNIGDGKIFVFPIEKCIRIRTKEKGSKAIG